MLGQPIIYSVPQVRPRPPARGEPGHLRLSLGPARPQDILAAWRQRSSRDPSWRQPEQTVLWPRFRRDVESECRALCSLAPGWAAPLGVGICSLGSHLPLPGSAARPIITTESGQNPRLPVGQLRHGEGHKLPKVSSHGRCGRKKGSNELWPLTPTPVPCRDNLSPREGGP